MPPRNFKIQREISVLKYIKPLNVYCRPLHFIEAIPVQRVLLTWLENVKYLFSVLILLLLNNNLLHPVIS